MSLVYNICVCVYFEALNQDEQWIRGQLLLL